jgi:hypothetical protein
MYSLNFFSRSPGVAGITTHVMWIHHLAGGITFNAQTWSLMLHICSKNSCSGHWESERLTSQGPKCVSPHAKRKDRHLPVGRQILLQHIPYRES